MKESCGNRVVNHLASSFAVAAARLCSKRMRKASVGWVLSFENGVWDAEPVNSFVVQSDAAPGNFYASIVSVGSSGFDLVEQIGKDQLTGENGGSHPWALADSGQDRNSCYSIILRKRSISTSRSAAAGYSGSKPGNWRRWRRGRSASAS